MRSRSQGRHPMHSDYCTTLGMPTYQADLYTSAVLSKQRSKSGTLYYSSGGSNDGRSPPPEIALLSGIPPPGPMIKKPTPRPKSLFGHYKFLFTFYGEFISFCSSFDNVHICHMAVAA